MSTNCWVRVSGVAHSETGPVMFCGASSRARSRVAVDPLRTRGRNTPSSNAATGGITAPDQKVVASAVLGACAGESLERSSLRAWALMRWLIALALLGERGSRRRNVELDPVRWHEPTPRCSGYLPAQGRYTPGSFATTAVLAILPCCTKAVVAVDRASNGEDLAESREASRLGLTDPLLEAVTSAARSLGSHLQASTNQDGLNPNLSRIKSRSNPVLSDPDRSVRHSNSISNASSRSRARGSCIASRGVRLPSAGIF